MSTVPPEEPEWRTVPADHGSREDDLDWANMDMSDVEG